MDVGSVHATSQLSGVSSQRMAQLKTNAVQSIPSTYETHADSYNAPVVLGCNPLGPEPQRSFFFWEVHEASARCRVNERVSPRPIMPVNSQINTALYLPTPSTGGSTSMVPARGYRSLTLQDTPTRSRARRPCPSTVATEYEDDEGSNLLQRIVALLSAGSFRLRPSTREHPSHLIREEIAIYEAKLQARGETIARLSRQLDQLS